jgi:cobalt/nickel transport system permease protein
MTLAFSLPPRTDSLLARLDPRWRLAGLLALLVVAAVLRALAAAALALGLGLLLAALAQLPRRWLLQRLGATLLALALFTLPLPFLLHGPGPSWHWGPLAVGSDGAWAALLLTLKGLTIVTLALVLLASGPLDATLKAAHALRLPGVLVHLALLSYRYVFLLADELGRLRVALRVRGYRHRANRHSYRTVAHVAGTLLVRGHDRAERVHQALRCRGFDGTFRSLAEFRTTAGDVLAFLLLLATAAGLAWLDWVLQ